MITVTQAQHFKKEADKAIRSVYSNSKFNIDDIYKLIDNAVVDYFMIPLRRINDYAIMDGDVITARYARFYLAYLYIAEPQKKIAKHYHTYIGHIVRGVKRFQEMNFRVKTEVVLHYALENMKTRIETELATNMNINKDNSNTL